MKRILVLLISAILILSFAACNQEEPNIQTTQTLENISHTETEGQTEETRTLSESQTAENPPVSEVPVTSVTPAPDETPVTTKPPASSRAPTTTTKAPVHTHSFNPATCTAPPTCSCGVTLGVELGHRFSQGTCSRCGAVDENYAVYLEKKDAILEEYMAEAGPIVQKINECEAAIVSTQNAINSARSELETLSPTCPQYFLQQYINNWQAYGNTYAATQAAQNAWSQQYNSRSTQLNSIISMKTAEKQSLEQDLRRYNMLLSDTNEKYVRKLYVLNLQYGIS